MRRVLLILSVLIALVALAAALSPYWLGAVVPAIARRFDATVGGYSTDGYGRFVLRDVVVRKPSATVTVSSLACDTPWLWAVRHLVGGDRPVIAGEWRVEVHPGARVATAPRPASGWVPLERRLLRIGDLLHRWLPEVKTGPGRVAWPGNVLEFAPVSWSDRTATTSRLEWRGQAAGVSVALGRGGARIVARVQLVDRPVALEAEGQGAAVRGKLKAWGQSAPLAAEFESTGWLPRTGSLDAVNWSLEGAVVGLRRYATLAGDVRLKWQQTSFDLHADIRGAPGAAPAAKAGIAAAPPLHVEAEASGDRRMFTVQRLTLEAPGVRAGLSAPVQLGYGKSARETPSRFHFEADLGQWPWLSAQGTMSGDIDVAPEPTGWPKLRLQATGENLQARAFALKQVRLSGRLAWPVATLDLLEIQEEPTGKVTVHGTADLERRALTDSRLEGRVPFEIVRRFFPPSLSFGAADVVVKASGPFETVQHEGTVLLSELQAKGFRPATGRLWWRGRGERVEEFDAGIRAGTTEFTASGALQAEACELRKLVWRHGDVDRLSLQRPATLRWKPDLSVDAFDLVGPAGELRLTGNWGPTGAIRFFARGIAAEWWRDFVPAAPFEWSIDRLSLVAGWKDNAPATLDTSGHLSLQLRGGRDVVLDLAAKSDGRALAVDHLTANDGTTRLASLSGRLPVGVVVAPKPRLVLGEGGDLALNASVNPEAEWWSELSKRTGLVLERPELTASLSGSWEHPRGNMSLDLARLSVAPRDGLPKLPRIQNLHAELVAAPDQLKLEPVEATIEGQRLTASVALPAGRDIWRKLRSEPKAFLLREGEIRLRGENLQLAPFVPYLSGVLQPQGNVDVDLTVSAEGPWSGYVRVNGAGTTPLGSLGPLRDIRTNLVASGRALRFEKAEASLGGRTVSVTGSVTLPPGQRPRFDLRAQGQNLPFVRQEGFLVRGDVDLKLVSDQRGGAPLVSGAIQLRDSLFLSDVRSLIPSGGGASPERRPPYFAVSQRPFSAWRLDVNLAGNHFLRARTTLFNGTASMAFHLVGTLGDPRALGEVRIDEGQVLFPFARFDLGDASVRLSEQNPYDPQLAIFGTSRRYGYDLKFELTGSATQPNLVFTSNPPLTSEQVVLLVMAGQTPQNEVSYSTGQRFARLGTYFGQSLLGSLSGGEGDDRLTINSGERISRQGRETYDVEYELNKRWTIVGEYDEFDEYNIGLKRRILPRPKKGESDENR